jgi:hypothetical protein
MKRGELYRTEEPSPGEYAAGLSPTNKNTPTFASTI